MEDWRERVPRLHYSLKSIKGQSIFWMKKSEWHKIPKDGSTSVHIVIDEANLPVTLPEKFLGAFYSGKFIEIYRNAPADYPYTRNLDRYEVIESMDKDLLEEAIIKGSTSGDCQHKFKKFYSRKHRTCKN